MDIAKVAGGFASSILGEVDEDQEVSSDVDEEAKDNDGIATETRRLGAQDAENKTAGDLAHADEHARESDKLFRIAFSIQALGIAHHSAVD